MFDLVLNSILLFSLLLLAVSLEGSLPSNACPGANANLTTILSRYLIAALVTFPGIAFTRLRDAERTLQRAATKLMSYAGVFSGRAYLSEILISAAVSIAFLGSFAARRLLRRLFRRMLRLDDGTGHAAG